MTTVDQPARGTRPANRRALILAAARDLFADRGYEHVSMGDVAEAVAVGPSALYRHFSGKQQLLTAVLLDELTMLARIIEASQGEPRDRLESLAADAFEHRRAGALLQREARHLPAQQRAAVREAGHEVEVAILTLTTAVRPDLGAHGTEFLTTGVMAALSSPAFTHLSLPRASWDALLAGAVQRLLDADLPAWAPAARADAVTGLTPKSRREALMAAALRLFAERTYASVGIEDVASAAGMAGASVYSHFSSKQEILVTALHRGASALAMDAVSVLASSTTPAQALRLLVERYADFALAHHDLVDVLVTELSSLEEPDHSTAVNAQHEYVLEWVNLLVEVHEGLAVPVARAQVHVTLMMINAIARSDRLRGADLTHDAVCELARRVLDV